MPTFVVERDIPGAGALSLVDLKAISRASNDVLRQMNRSGEDVQWVHSYITANKLYCVYSATSEAVVRDHSTRAGFPVNRVLLVSQVIDPTTAV
jgi:hypothetical protein